MINGKKGKGTLVKKVVDFGEEELKFSGFRGERGVGWRRRADASVRYQLWRSGTLKMSCSCTVS